MSIALYRKYRPVSFAEVRGQEHVTEPLQQALRNGRVHHAYLFSGPRGCGKTSGARILARSLNCEHGPTPQPCGECDSCVALAPDGPGSIDVIEIDAASHGGVDDARELRERAFFAPAASRYKVYVVDEAHMVTREGFNALLKLVEEPPPHLKFVFATTEPDKVIGTIRSRTHHYPFRLLPPALLRELLADVCAQENVDIDLAALPLVVRAGAGSARDSLSILEQILAGAESGQVTYEQAIQLLGYTDASLLDEVVEAFAAADGARVFEVVNRVVDGGHDPRRFATDLLERFRDLVILRSVPDAGTKGLLQQPPDQMERMLTQAGRMGAAELSRAADLLHDGLTEMRGATSPRLLLELICARLLLPATGTDPSALLARLDRVERRLAISGNSPEASVASAAPSALRNPQPAVPESEAEPAPAEKPSHLRAVPARTDDPSSAEEAGQTASGSATSTTSSTPLAPSTEPSQRPEQEADPAAAVTERAGSPPSSVPGDAPDEAAKPAAAGSLDVTAVRRAWPEILEEVKARRRVAWMILIGDVHVSAVDARTLTLDFAKDGDRKGFTSSGSDRTLQEALQQVLGVSWQIHTRSGAEDAATGSTSPPVAAPPPDPSGPPEHQAPDSGPPPEASFDPAPGSDPAREEKDEGDGGASGSTAAAGGAATDLSGMALIERELGGQVIEELDDS